jgi:hypothetical protein
MRVYPPPRIRVPGRTLLSGDVLDGGYDRRFAAMRYTEVIG